MGASNTTALVGLPQFEDTDKPTWRGDVNTAFDLIDAYFAGINASVNSLGSNKADKLSLSTINVRDYGATADGVTDDTAAIQNAINAANALSATALHASTVYIPKGTYKVTSTLYVAADSVKIKGDGQSVSKLVYSGASGTACIASNNTAIRRKCTIEDIFVSCITAGAIALLLDNAYRWVMTNCSFESQNGTTGVGVDIVGDLTKSTYFNTFMNCNFWGSLDSVRLTDNVNGTRFFGGVIEGPGRSIKMSAPNSNLGTNMFFGVGIQSSGANTGGVIIQIGLSTDTHQCSYNSFIGCRVETATATSWINEVNAWFNSIIGGSVAGPTTITDNVVASGAALLQLMHSSNSVLPFKFPWSLTASGSLLATTALIAGLGGANETTYSAGSIRTTGTAASINLYIAAKGSGAVQLNASANDPVTGFTVYSGGATPAIRAILAAQSGNRGIDLKPANGFDGLWIYKNGAAQPDFKIAEDGKISWGLTDGSGTFDTTLARTAANVLATGTDDVFMTGKNVTASRPSAATVGVGAQFYDTTLMKPIWSDGANWRDAMANVV